MAEGTSVAAWLCLEEREETGDFHLREVRKRIEIRHTGCSGKQKTAPIFADESRELLRKNDADLAEYLWQKLGVADRGDKPGLPKGPYYDSADASSIGEEIEQALAGSEDA